MQPSFFERCGGTYTQVGDILLPDLVPEDIDRPPIGKYGRMRRRYLKEHRPVLYMNLLVTRDLFGHLAEIDKAAQEQLDRIVSRLAARRGITEQLKAADQMRWIQEMNNILAAAEEIILQELIDTD